VSSPKDDDVEIDIGRYARRVVARWWIVAATVVVVVAVAVLTQTGSSSQTWSARTLLYLGQPLGANGQPLNTSLGSNPATPGILIRNDNLLARAAREAGLRSGQLKGHVSSQVLSQAITRTNYTPLVNIVVQGLGKDRVAPASLAVARQIVAATNGYQDTQEKALSQVVATQKRTLDAANKRLTTAQATLDLLAKAKNLDPFQEFSARTTAIQTINSISTQIAALEDSYSTNVQILAALQHGVAKSQIVEEPKATRATATSGGANIGVAVLLGLVLGVVLALASYAIRR
jgi:uncharacterized protein involved in exopolysaccharide biosynthesis